MAIKEMDVFDIAKRSFDWAKEPKQQRLFGAFFASDVFSSSLICILAIILLSVAFWDIISKIFVILEQITLIDIDSIVLGVVIALVLTSGVVLVAILMLKWDKDEEFIGLVKQLTAVNFAVTAISLAGIFTIGYVIISMSIPSIIKEYPGLEFLLGLSPESFPSVHPAAAVALIVISLAIIILASLFWEYVRGIFLLGKALEYRGKKNEFAKVSFDGYVKYLKLIIVYLFTVLFNWINKKVLAVQIALIVLCAIMMAIMFAMFAAWSSAGAMAALAFLLLVALIYTATTIYNSFRMYVIIPVRILEAKGAKDAVTKAWNHMRGYALAAFILIIILTITIFAISLVEGVIDSVFRVPISKGFLPVVSVPIYVFVILLVSAFTTTVCLFIPMFAMLAFYDKVVAAEKAEKSKKKTATKD
ncbi:MAG: hypothetical protein QW112_00960 [Candidatus Micrarchaeia archaeon]